MHWHSKALCKAESTTHSIHYATMLTKLCFSCQWRCCADSDPTVLSVTLLCCKWTYFVLSLPLMSCLWSYSAVNDPTVLSLTLLFCQWPYSVVIDLTVLSLTLLCCHWPYCSVIDPTVLSMTLLCCQWPYYAVSDLTVLVSAPFHGTVCNQTWKMSVLWESQAPAPLLLVYSVDATELHCRWSPCVTGFELTFNFSVLNNWSRCGKKFCNVFKSDKFCAHLFSVALMTKIHVHVP